MSVFRSLSTPFHFVRSAVVACAAVCGLACASVVAAEYQWSVPVVSAKSDETNSTPRAYLWISPNCERVRGIVVGQHNMLEEPILEHPKFRAKMAELGFAEVWVTPAIGGLTQFGPAERAHFEGMFQALADVSGYTEIARAPVVPIGHSAMAEFPYLFAAHIPERTLAAISIKGSWPDLKRTPPPAWSGKDVAGVPLLFVSGEYEWAEERAGKILPFRQAFPDVPFSMIADAGGGHFDPHDALSEYLADYIAKAAKYRLSEAGSLLRVIDAARQGWLVDRWRMDRSPRAAAGPVGKYGGDARETFWCFDEEHAAATEKMQAAYSGKKPQLVGYEQGGATVAQDPKTHQQVTLTFQPDAAGDGLSFSLKGVFLDTVPSGRPERWTKQSAGAPIGHANGGGPVTIRRICGPVEKLDENRFAIRFDRLGFDNPRRSPEIWLLAEHPGDGEYKRAVQQAVMRFPLRNTAGKPQSLSFEAIPAQKAGSTAIIPLHVSSSAGADAKPRFYVKEGPAEITPEGGLRLLPIPPRAKFPMKVSVVAWQWGRSIEPKLQSAEPVVQEFWVK